MQASSSGPYLVRHPLRATSSCFSEPQKSTVFIQCLVSTLLTFFKFPKSSARFRCVTSLAPRNPTSNVGYCDISEWHVRSVCPRALPPASRLHLTYPCAEPKGSQPKYMVIYLLKTPLHLHLWRSTIYQPLRSGRIWHKVNFLSGV